MHQKSIKESCLQLNAHSSRGSLGIIGVWKREKQNKTGVYENKYQNKLTKPLGVM